MNKASLLKKLNYLNMKEIHQFCKKRRIPYVILVEEKNGKLIKSKDKDRKGIVLDRIRQYIKTRRILSPTVYSNKVCSNVPLSRLNGSTRLHYGQYDKYNPKLISELKNLTDGKFKNGSIAREVLRDFWTNDKVPTLKQFATAWLKASKNDKKNHAEWAFLTDLSKGIPTSDWKSKRDRIAKAVLSELSGRRNYI